MGWSQDVASIASPLGPSRTPIPKMACTWVASRPFPAHRLLKSPDLLLEKHEDRRRWNHVWGNRRPEVHDMFWLSPSANIQSSSTLPIVSTQPVHICLVVSLGCFFPSDCKIRFWGVQSNWHIQRAKNGVQNFHFGNIGKLQKPKQIRFCSRRDDRSGDATSKGVAQVWKPPCVGLREKDLMVHGWTAKWPGSPK